MNSKYSLITKIALVIALAGVIVSTIFLVKYVTSSPFAIQAIADMGYLGVAFFAIIFGLNVVVPIPAATFTPIFYAAGMWLPFIILALTFGTLIADYIGYALVRLGHKTLTTHTHRKRLEKFIQTYENHKTWLLPIIFIHSAFVPFPNEVIIIPLALLGIRFRTMLIPLLLGNIVSHTTIALGMQSLISYIW